MPLYTATDTGHQSSASEYSIKYPPPLLAPPPPNLLENINLDSVFFLPFILLSPLSLLSTLLLEYNGFLSSAMAGLSNTSPGYPDLSS